MAAGAPGDGDDELITAINITPLTDIILVLLIILMVTASYVVSRTIPMELPKSSTGEAADRTLVISIDEHGGLFLAGDPITEAELQRQARAAHRANPDARASIAADGRISHAKFVHIVDLLRRERVTKFAINVRPEDVAQ